MMFEQLKKHHNDIADRSILSLFDTAGRAEDYRCQLGDMVFDYSKTNIGAEARAALIDLVQIRDVAGWARAMFAGETVNQTEGRAVLHTALRNLDGGPVMVAGSDVMPEVRDSLARMAAFANALRSGAYQGQGGAITDVVNIGIGGSDLGPAMACLALAPYHDGPRCHFVSNIDGAHLADTLHGLDPATTLVIVASKTFTTIETMTNAQSARDWMLKTVKAPARQFVALSSAQDKTAAFGIAPDRVFGFADWVGGRYSLWGPIG
jgi:glucose-6-phosphate isomerase